MKQLLKFFFLTLWSTLCIASPQLNLSVDNINTFPLNTPVVVEYELCSPDSQDQEICKTINTPQITPSQPFLNISLPTKPQVPVQDVATITEQPLSLTLTQEALGTIDTNQTTVQSQTVQRTVPATTPTIISIISVTVNGVPIRPRLLNSAPRPMFNKFSSFATLNTCTLEVKTNNPTIKLVLATHSLVNCVLTS